MTDKISRRTAVLRGLQIPVGGAFLFGLAGCGGADKSASSMAGRTVCANPQAMSDSESRTRDSLHYVEYSTDPQKVCAGCAMFHPGDSAEACGTCDMYSGGPANPHGYCDSWSARS